MKIKNNFKNLLLLRTSAVSILGIILIFLTTTFWLKDMVKQNFNEEQSTLADLFSQNIRNDLLLGNFHEIDRKCDSFFISSNLKFLVVLDSDRREVCNLGSKPAKEDSSVFIIHNQVSFDDQKNQFAGLISIGFNMNKVDTSLSKIFFGIGLILMAIASFQILIIVKSTKSTAGPIEKLVQVLISGDLIALSNLKSPNKVLEIQELYQGAQSLSLSILKGKQIEKQLIEQKAFSEIAKQVAHDIRSPLSALNVAAISFHDLPEEKRNLIKNATNRISDIANELLSKSKEAPVGMIDLKVGNNICSKNSPILLQPVINSLLSEKRLLLQNQTQIIIESDFRDSDGTAINAESKEVQRILSNLINNSVEAAINGSIKITIGTRTYRDSVQLFVRDNGTGIPTEILSKLGNEGVSFGKEGSKSGTGLGIFHAKKYLDSLGGNFLITSNPDSGTLVQLTFPRIN